MNTCGVFKGFYKNKITGKGQFGGTNREATKRITEKIQIKNPPFLSNFETKKIEIYQEDSNELVKKLKKMDFVYLDPPYNQHPYGSNYFMLNIIAKNKLKTKNISKISGIPKDWNRSNYNKRKEAFYSLKDLIDNLDTKFFLLSYSNEGLIDIEEIKKISNKFKIISEKIIKYNSFRGSKNLKTKKNKYVKEFLFLFQKKN